MPQKEAVIQNQRVQYALKNPLRGTVGCVVEDLGGQVQGGGTAGEYLYPSGTHEHLFIHQSDGTPKEVSLLTDTEIATYRSTPIYNEQGQQPYAGGSAGAMTFDDFLPVPDVLKPLIFPTLSSLDGYIPAWAVAYDYIYDYGDYDPSTRTFTPKQGIFTAGPWPLGDLEWHAPYLTWILRFDPLVKYTVVRSVAPGALIGYAGGTFQVSTKPLGVLDMAYLYNHGWDMRGGDSSLLYSGYPIRWNIDATHALTTPESITELLVIGKDALTDPWFVTWQDSSILDVSHIPDVNALSKQVAFTVNGVSYVLQIALGPLVRGCATVRFVLLDGNGNSIDLTPSDTPDPNILAQISDPIASANAARQHMIQMMTQAGYSQAYATQYAQKEYP